MKSKRPLLFLILLCAAVPLFSIELTTPDWEIVADGVSVSKPAQTSWGYVTVTDGRTLIGWTESGRKRFQTKLTRKPSEELCVDYADFIWLVSYDRQYLTQFNGDGVLMWEKTLPSACTAAPLVPGKDGRLFVPLENSILCVDMNGKTVWEYTLTDGQPLSLIQADDGVLICNGNIVLSPFGELLYGYVIPQNEANTPSQEMIHTASCDFVISDNSRNSAITAYDFDGNELWSKSFAPEKVLFYEITDTTIMTLSESWVIAGWKYNSQPVPRKAAQVPDRRIYDADYGVSSAEMNYSVMVTCLNRIIQIAGSLSVNGSVRDVVYDIRYIKKAETSGFDFSALLADIILNETDMGVLETAVAAAGSIGRDADGQIFSAIEARLKQRTQFQFDDSMYAAFCDAIYAICRKSGGTERIIRALQIISPLNSTDYHSLVQRHAFEIMEKLVTGR